MNSTMEENQIEKLVITNTDIGQCSEPLDKNYGIKILKTK